MSTNAAKITTIALVGAAIWTAPAFAQIPVIDESNFLVNTTTSISQVLNTIEAVLQTAYMALEILGIEELAVDGEFENDLDTLVLLVNEGAQVAWDLQSITRQVKALFDLDAAPETVYALSKRQQEIRRTLMEAYTTAVRVQTLIRTAAHTVAHIKKLLDRIQGFTGNQAANQNISEGLSSLKRLEATQTAQNAAFQRAMTLQAMEKPLVEESMKKINDAFCGKWCIEK